VVGGEAEPYAGRGGGPRARVSSLYGQQCRPGVGKSTEFLLPLSPAYRHRFAAQLQPLQTASRDSHGAAYVDRGQTRGGRTVEPALEGKSLRLGLTPGTDPERRARLTRVAQRYAQSPPSKRRKNGKEDAARIASRLAGLIWTSVAAVAKSSRFVLGRREGTALCKPGDYWVAHRFSTGC